MRRPFLCPDDRLGELEEVLTVRSLEAPPLQVGVIGTAGPDGLADAVNAVVADCRLALAAVELPVGAADPHRVASVLADVLPDGALGYVEVPPRGEWEQALDALAATGLRAKLRTGGDWPGVRGTGFEEHGFCNLLLATRAGLAGGSSAELAVILGERDEQQVAEEVRGLGGPAEAAVRAAFASYGTCSVTDPVDDLVRLGLVRGEAA